MARGFVPVLVDGTEIEVGGELFEGAGRPLSQKTRSATPTAPKTDPQRPRNGKARPQRTSGPLRHIKAPADELQIQMASPY